MKTGTYRYWLAMIGTSYCIGTAQATDKPDYGFKGEYILQRAVYGDEVCKRFKDNLNRFRKLDFDTCHPRLSDKFPEFSRPYQWQEIPFDLSLAEKAIRSWAWADDADASMFDYNKSIAEKRWATWVRNTEQLRTQGKARMWTTRLDINADGGPETILRLEPGWSGSHYSDNGAIYQCDYDKGEFYVIEARNPKTAGRFNRMSGNAGDIMQDSKTGNRYLLSWARRSSGADVGISLPWQGPMPDIGATRGVVVRSLSPMHNSTEFNPGVDVCIVDWVPEGKYKPASKRLAK